MQYVHKLQYNIQWNMHATHSMVHKPNNSMTQRYEFRDYFVDNLLRNHTKKYTGGTPCNIYIGSYNPVCMHISLMQNKPEMPEGLLSK